MTSFGSMFESGSAPGKVSIALACLIVTQAVPGAPVRAQEGDAGDGPAGGFFAETRSGSWQARARRLDENSGPGPGFECEMFTDSARYTQVRSAHSNLLSFWGFPLKSNRNISTFDIDRVVIDSRSFQVAGLPWRLAREPEEGEIVVASDRLMFAFRSSDEDEWLPFEYLSDDIMRASDLRVHFSFEDDEGVVGSDSVTIDLRGFRSVAKWCGRQLLADRIDDRSVVDLIT